MITISIYKTGHSSPAGGTIYDIIKVYKNKGTEIITHSYTSVEGEISLEKYIYELLDGGAEILYVSDNIIRVVINKKWNK